MKCMDAVLKYSIFRVRWGYFGLLGDKKGLLRTCLPVGSREKSEQLLLASTSEADFDVEFFADLQKRITAYFEGRYVEFDDTAVILGQMSGFARKVLTDCRNVKYGKSMNYAALAESAGAPKAARAAANVLGANRMPLIIPCHRIIRTNGKIGGFSAPGGVELKKKMLQLELQAK